MKIKRILSVTFIVMLFAVLFSVNVEASAGGSNYRSTTRLESNALDYGVMHYKELGLTLKAGTTDTYDPQQINIVEVPSTTGVKVTTWAKFDNNEWNFATVKQLILDYEKHNPGWSVIAAVNGDFFDINRDESYGSMLKQVRGPQVTDGEYYRTRAANNSSTSVGFTNDGTADSVIGLANLQRTATMKLAVYDENGAIINTFDVEKLNEAPGDNEASVYFPTYTGGVLKTFTTTAAGKSFVVGAADLSLPTNFNDFYGKGDISAVDVSEISLGRGAFAIDSNKAEINEALAVGTKIRIQYEYVGAYAKATSVVGVESTVLKDGNFVQGDNRDRHPRTVLGRKADGTIVMAVIDGRQESSNMYGVSYAEIAAVMQAYNCVDAYNLDGGGSSTMVIREKGELVVKNSPSDGRERSDSNCVLVATRTPEFKTELVSADRTSLTLNVNVANANGHDIKKIIVRGAGDEAEVVDGTVTLTKLKASTAYTMSITYIDSNNKRLNTTFRFSYSTTGYPPTFKGISFTKDQENFNFEIDYTDRSNVANVQTADININGVDYQFADGKLTIPAATESMVVKVILTYVINDANGERTIVLVNPHSEFIKAVDEVFEKRQQMFSSQVNIFK